MTKNGDKFDDTAATENLPSNLDRFLYWLRLSAAAALTVAIFAGYVEHRPLPEDAVPILEYHMAATYTDDVSYEYNVPPTELRRQLQWLKDNGYQTVSLLDLMKAKKGKLTLPEKPIVLTFDDGYDDNYFELLPLLKEYGMTATIFMITNKIGTEGYLTWSDLRELNSAGFEIASHTANHLPLNKIPSAKYDDEIYLSKLLLEWNGIRTVFFLSYPNGKYNADLLRYLKEHEFLGAVTGDAGYMQLSDDSYLMRRVNIPHPKFGIEEFRWRLWKAEFMTKLKNINS